VTTGPLGQGFANGVGLGIAERWLRAHFSADVCDHHTYVVAGDGCLEEGISHEAASLAGHLRLGRLVYVYDDNHITIDGPTELALNDNVAERFDAYGWSVDDIGDVANDLDTLEAALLRARAEEERPSLIVLRSHIGYPAPDLTDSSKAHGDPFSDEETAKTKELLGLPVDETFWCPRTSWPCNRSTVPRGRALRSEWAARLDAWTATCPVRGRARRSRVTGMGGGTPRFAPSDGPMATRKAIKVCLDATHDGLPGLMPGSADLTGNTGMALAGALAQSVEDPGAAWSTTASAKHAMGAVMTGMADHGGTLPVGGTFFVFSDYMRGAVRVAALSGAHVVYSWTHDSIGLGQDGPTHQPVEQLAAIRAMPGLRVIRPADANETAQAWRIGRRTRRPHRARPVPPGPACSRVHRRPRPRGRAPRRLRTRRPGRRAGPGDLLATGSEVPLCVDAARLLAEAGTRTRIVSLPSWELFAEQGDGYRAEVLTRASPCCRSRPPPPSVGSGTPTTPSASTTSGRPPRARW